jgi:hypothetical protein
MGYWIQLLSTFSFAEMIAFNPEFEMLRAGKGHEACESIR